MGVDLSKVNEYQNGICQSIEVISNNLLKKVAFDKTIIATITDTTDKKEGKYQCSTGTNIFTAYSTVTDYEKGTSVYVSIPNGEWTNQKMIVGRKVNENEENEVPFTYITPLNSILDMTGNLYKINENGIYSITATNSEEVKLTEEIFSGDISIPSDMTRLVVSADFKTYLSSAKEGTYGIQLFLIENGGDTYTYTFTNKEMFGNTYNFSSYYNQQIAFDISELKEITKLKMFLYQENDFKFNGEQIPSFDVDNIYCRNIYLCAGKEIELFDSDKVFIWTEDGSSFAKENESNDKTIKLNWVHLDENKNAKLMNSNTLGEDKYLVTWYKYDVSAKDDGFGGSCWERQDEAIFGLEEITYNFTPNTEKQQEFIKASIYKYIGTKTAEEDIIKDGRTAWTHLRESEELIFTNEEIVPSQETIDKDNALEIVIEDNSNGNYYLYGQDKKILEETDCQKQRVLSCRFGIGEEEKKDCLELSNSSIEWKIPTSMFYVLNGEYATENGISYYIVNDENPQYRIEKNLYKDREVITCKFTQYGRTYSASKEFNFGRKGTMGTDTTLIVELCSAPKDNGPLYEVNGIYENDFISKADTNLSWEKGNYFLRIYTIKDGEMVYSNNFSYEVISGELGITPFSSDGGLYAIAGLSLKEKNKKLTDYEDNQKIFVVKVSAGDLETYYSIPVYNDENMSYITGPTSILYNSAGSPDYFNETYQLYDTQNKLVEIKTSEVIIEENAEANYIGTIENNKLTPYLFYVENAPVYGVKFSTNSGYWIQPIITLKNRWSSGVINQWDGSVQISKDGGYILSPAIAAGKKESDNTFSGVMLGDWGEKDISGEIASQTGIYGFHKGNMSYAFKEDGTAFLGEKLSGRIEIDGNKATLYSGTWIDTDGDIKIDDDSSSTGMLKIDLNTPSIELKKENSEGKYNRITLNGAAKEKEYPFLIGNNFKVKWDGTLYARDGDFSGNINATSGSIIGDLTISEKGNLYISATREDISTKQAAPLKVKYNEDTIGSFGVIKGDDVGTSTYNIGISSDTEDTSIVLFSKKNIRLTAIENFYLEAKFPNEAGNPAVTICNGGFENGYEILVRDRTTQYQLKTLYNYVWDIAFSIVQQLT